MSYLVEIGKNMALLRRAKELTQEKAADMANLSVNRWQELEYGGRNATIDTLDCIAKALEVDPLALGIFEMPDSEIAAMFNNRPKAAERLPKPEHFGGGIVSVRKGMGLTQKQLGALARVSTARLRDIEHGCANVTVEVLERIAAALNMSLLALFTIGVSRDNLFECVKDARKRAKAPEERTVA